MRRKMRGLVGCAALGLNGDVCGDARIVIHRRFCMAGVRRNSRLRLRTVERGDEGLLQ